MIKKRAMFTARGGPASVTRRCLVPGMNSFRRALLADFSSHAIDGVQTASGEWKKQGVKKKKHGGVGGSNLRIRLDKWRRRGS